MHIMFTDTGRKYGTDGVGEDLQYDTLKATDTFWMRRFQLAWHSYSCHRDTEWEEMLSERLCHILLPSGGCTQHPQLQKKKREKDTTEGETATGTHPSFIG